MIKVEDVQKITQERRDIEFAYELLSGELWDLINLQALVKNPTEYCKLFFNEIGMVFFGVFAPDSARIGEEFAKKYRT